MYGKMSRLEGRNVLGVKYMKGFPFKMHCKYCN